jgi:uncharacterized protein (TIGR03083 family)
MAADATVLGGLDPFDLMDGEAARLDDYFAGLSDAQWDAPSACAGWTVKDVLAHLAASEEYNRACMTDAIAPLMEQMGARGVTDVNSFNDVGVTDRAERSTDELLDEWRRECGETRTWLRANRGGDMPTMVGPYSVDWQAFHLANELAIHADDVGVPVTEAESSGREAWLAAFARFAVSENDKPVTIEPSGDGYLVSTEGVSAELTEAELVAAVNARLDDGTTLDPQLAAALNFMG